MEKELIKLTKAHNKYEEVYKVVDNKINEVCDFEAGLTFCDGDGHMIINVGNSMVASLWLLEGKTIKNKLTEEEFNKYTK